MDTNNKPMYQPWNEEEFQADVFVRGMTWLQRHLYRALLQAMFFHSTRPYLPADDEMLWVLSGAESPEMWEQNKTRILKRFTVVPERPGLLENRRVTADWERITDARNKMAELGQRSAAVRLALNGTAQPQKPAKMPVVLTCAERAFDDRSNGARTGPERGPNKVSEVSEVKEKEKKEEKDNQDAREDFSSKKQQSTADWKNIAIRYRKVFGKKAGAEFQKKYYEACQHYTEDVVLECFDLWATEGKREWCEANNFDKPLHLFFKKLPEEAEDALAINNEIKSQDIAALDAKHHADIAQAKSEERQGTEHLERFAIKEPVNAESAADFLKD